MPIIDKYKTIFIHIPKTAGTSIERTLIDYSLNYKGDLKNWYGKVQGYELDHSTLKFMKQHCRYYNESYLKFCVVRNPYERLVSEYHYCKRYFSRFIKHTNTFREFVLFLRDHFQYVLDNEEKRHFQISHYLPQHKFTHINGECAMDFVIKYETLSQDWTQLCQKLNINIDLLKVDQNSSKHTYNYLDYYDDELKNIVYDLYKEDFIIFQYEK